MLPILQGLDGLIHVQVNGVTMTLTFHKCGKLRIGFGGASNASPKHLLRDSVQEVVNLVGSENLSSFVVGDDCLKWIQNVKDKTNTRPLRFDTLLL